MRIVSLDPLDIGVIALFLTGILALGFSARLRDNTLLQYIAAGRRLTLPIFVATLVSTWYGGILGVGESVSYYGLGTWLLLGVPYYVFALIYAFAFAKRVRGAEEISLPERLHTRFGRGAGIVGALLVFCLAVPAAHVLMLGILAQALTGWTLLLSVLAGCGIGILFLYRGGLLADARVSLLAFVMMYVGFAVAVVFCLVNYPPVETFSTVDKTLLDWTAGKGPILILSFFLLGAWTLVDPAFHQRVASAIDPHVSQKGVLISVGFWFLSDVLLITAGMYAVALVKPFPEQTLLAYPALGEQVLPPGLKAVFVCGMLGTILSAMVGYTLVSGATFGRELLGRLKPDLPEASLTAWSKAGLFVGCALAVVLAMNVKSVVTLWYTWGGAVIGALLIPVSVSYGLIRTQASNAWVVASMLLAFGVSFAWMIYGINSDNVLLEVTLFEQKVSLGTLIPGLIISALIIGIGGVVGRRQR